MKYYRVKQDNFLWKEGAIIKLSDNGTGYTALEDIWNAVPAVNSEYISARIIEHPDNAAFFERVYPDSIKERLFRTKDALVAKYKESFV